jgi:hypothetical protein
MDLEFKIINRLRSKLACTIFVLLLGWPLIHIIIINNSKISSWRYFGWGMYATPNPHENRRLSVVILNKNRAQSTSLIKLHEALNNLSLCLNIFEELDSNLRRLPDQNLCYEESLAMSFDFFMHFGSPKNLNKLVKEALARVQRSDADALAFLTYQRFNIFQRKAYLESDIYQIADNKVIYLGKVKSEG